MNPPPPKQLEPSSTMPPTRLSYPNSTGPKQAHNPAPAFLSLQSTVAAFTVRIRGIDCDLADYHAGMELSVAGPKPRAVNESSTRFSRPQRRRQTDGTQLRSPMPESGKEEPGPGAGAFFAPAAARVGSRKPGMSEAEAIVSGEGF